jgi:hypothetical protein
MSNAADVDRIRRLAAQLSVTDPGPGSALAAELAEAVAGLSARVDALWQLISEVVASAGLAGPADADSDGARADFTRAMTSARRTGQHGLHLRIDGREWVAALSQESPGQGGQHLPDPDQAAWSAIERLARESSAHDDG